MGTDKRARQKANRQARLAEVEAEEEKESREESTKKFGKIAAIVGGLIALIVLWNVFTGGDDDDAPIAEVIPTVGAEAAPTPTPEIVLADEVPADFAAFAGDRGLTNVIPAARNEAYSSAPAMLIDQSKTYAAAIQTDLGVIRFDLFDDDAPLAVNSFIALANDGFFDGLTFHRVEPGFVIQGGDPLGNGFGGPGYEFDGEFATETVFEGRGQVAMANDGNTDGNGSQFFITLSDSAPVLALTGKHTIFGAVGDLENATALDAIEAAGGATITSVRILES